MAEKQTAIMTKELQSERYAVIGFRWNDIFPEFVIAYRDEESLREPAGSSVIGIGFRSREAEAANGSSRDSDSKNIQDETILTREDKHCGPESRMQRLRNRIGLTETRRIAYAALQHAIAVAVVVFCSRSLLGAAIRACVGA